MVDCTKNLVTVYKLGHCPQLSDMYRHYTDALQSMSDMYTEESKSSVVRCSHVLCCSGSHILEHMSNFYQLYSIRHEPLQELNKAKELHRANMNKAEPKLLEKKERLFKAKDVNKWELDKEALNHVKELMENKELAFQHMLPKETAEVQRLKDRFVFFTNQCVREVRRTNADDSEEGREQFRIIARALQEVSAKKRDAWNRFEKEFELDYDQVHPQTEDRCEEKKQQAL